MALRHERRNPRSFSSARSFSSSHSFSSSQSFSSSASSSTSSTSIDSWPRHSIVAQYSQHGEPESVVSLECQPLPATLSSRQLLLQFLASPVNPSDLNMIEGVYHVRPTLPAVAGSEGVARVIGVADDVRHFAVGDHVIPARAAFGTWRTIAIASEHELTRINKKLSIEQAATLSVNPCTAYRMLHDFVSLKPGDVVIQNGATSAVGMCVIGLCKHLGVQSINVIRDRPDMEQCISRLHEAGATHVINESSMNDQRTRDLIKSLPKAKLALNCVGGQSSTLLAKHLMCGAPLITYGGMSKRPVQLPTSLFIFNDLRCVGFWLTRWCADHSKEEREDMLWTVSDLVLRGVMSVPVTKVPFNDIVSALQMVKHPHRGTKIVFDFSAAGS